jgi:hypothetical protein
MQTLNINVNNDQLLRKVIRYLEQFKKDGLEIVSKEDLDDLKLLKSTRNEESISFGKYLKNED